MQRNRSNSSKTAIKIRRQVFSTDFKLAKDEFACEYLKIALKHCDGNISQTAQKLGVSRRTLQIHCAKLREKSEPILA